MIGDAREGLLKRIVELSKTWKEEKAAKDKEKEKQKQKEGSTASSTDAKKPVEISDDEIEVGEVITRSDAKKAARAKARANNEPRESKASRLR